MSKDNLIEIEENEENVVKTETVERIMTSHLSTESINYLAEKSLLLLQQCLFH